MVFWLAVAGLVVTCLAAIGAQSLAEFSRHELEEICRRRKRARPARRRSSGGTSSAGLAAETLQVVGTAVFVGAGGVLDLARSRRPAQPPGWTLAGSSLAGRRAACCWRSRSGFPGRSPGSGPRRSSTTPGPLWRAVGVVLCPLVLGAPLRRHAPAPPGRPAARRRPTKSRSRRKSARSSPRATARACWRKTPAR